MKKKLALLVLSLAALAGFAGTCVISNVGWTVIEDDFYYGAEMKNDSGADILQHTFVIAFVEDGVLLEQVATVGCLRSMQNGASNFYSEHTGLGDPDDVVAISRLNFDGMVIGEVANGDLELSNITVQRAGTTLTVTGTMKNDSNDTYDDARACAVLRNKKKEVVRVEHSSRVDLDPGESANFTISFQVPNDKDIATTVDVWADALNEDEDDKPIEPESSLNHTVTTPTPTATGTPATSTPTATATEEPTATPTP